MYASHLVAMYVRSILDAMPRYFAVDWPLLCFQREFSLWLTKCITYDGNSKPLRKGLKNWKTSRYNNVMTIVAAGQGGDND